MDHWQICSAVQLVPFSFWWRYFYLCRFYIIWCSPIYFYFTSFALGGILVKKKKRRCYEKYVKFYSLCFPPGFSRYYNLYLGLLSILSLFWFMVYHSALVSFCCMYQSSSPNSICWTDCLYSIACTSFLCQILTVHKVMSLFLGSLFCSTDLCVCSYASITLVWLQCPCNIIQLKYEQMTSLQRGHTDGP